MEEGDDGERQRRGEVGVGRWCEADRDGDGEWECEWNGCRNPIQSGFRWIFPHDAMRTRKGRKFLRQHRFVALVGDFEVAGEVQPILVAGKPT